MNEERALSPRQLQKTINRIMCDIPEYSDIVNKFIYFLSFHMNLMCNKRKSNQNTNKIMTLL